MKKIYSIPKTYLKVNALRMTILAGSSSDPESIFAGNETLPPDLEFDAKVKSSVNKD